MPRGHAEAGSGELKSNCISYHSLHELSLWAYQETASAPLRRVHWMPPPDFTAAARIRIAQNQGETLAKIEEEPKLF